MLHKDIYYVAMHLCVYSTMLCHFIVCISLYRTVKLHLYVCSYYGMRLSNLIKETTYLLTYLQIISIITPLSLLRKQSAKQFLTVCPFWFILVKYLSFSFRCCL